MLHVTKKQFLTLFFYFFSGGTDIIAGAKPSRRNGILCSSDRNFLLGRTLTFLIFKLEGKTLDLQEEIGTSETLKFSIFTLRVYGNDVFLLNMLVSAFTFKTYYLVSANYFLPTLSSALRLLLMKFPESFSLFPSQRNNTFC